MLDEGARPHLGSGLRGQGLAEDDRPAAWPMVSADVSDFAVNGKRRLRRRFARRKAATLSERSSSVKAVTSGYFDRLAQV